MKPNKVVPRYPTLALEKGLDILALFASEPAGLTKSYFRNAQSFRDWRESKCVRLSIKQSVVYCSRPQITHCQQIGNVVYNSACLDGATRIGRINLRGRTHQDLQVKRGPTTSLRSGPLAAS